MSIKYKFKMKPYAHQLTALEKSWNKESYAYFMEMCTGKTKVLIDNMSMLYDKGKVNGALIIAPKGVVKTWYEQELPTHSCLLYTSPSPRDRTRSRMPSSA